MKQTLIDVRDLDHTWWEKVEAYRDGGTLHLSRASVERIGEIDPATGDALLVGGFVEARAGSVEVDGVETPVWSVGLEQLVTRPSRPARGEGWSR